MRRPNVIAYSVAAIIAAVLVLGALTMIRVVGFNTDLDFSVETVEEYARWCGRMGDPVAKELDKGRGISGWGNIAEALVVPIREAEAIDPAPNGLEEFHEAKLASLKGMSDLARTKQHSRYVDTIEIRKEAATLDPLEEGLVQAAEGLSPEIASALRQSGCIYHPRG